LIGTPGRVIKLVDLTRISRKSVRFKSGRDHYGPPTYLAVHNIIVLLRQTLVSASPHLSLDLCRLVSTCVSCICVCRGRQGPGESQGELFFWFEIYQFVGDVEGDLNCQRFRLGSYARNCTIPTACQKSELTRRVAISDTSFSPRSNFLPSLSTDWVVWEKWDDVESVPPT
jgi:hypothetical protein